MNTDISRRRFLRSAGALGGGLLLLPSTRGAGANERVDLALVGVGGRGEWFVGAMPGLHTRFAALCDVREERVADVGAHFPEAKRYTDFRRMLDEMQGDIDGVIVATPDHTHAVVCAKALRAGKHVFCEKPLTRTLGEARALRDLARASGRATQMGNQGTSSDAFRRSVEILQSGALGQVREVLAWNEAGGGGPHPRPAEAEPLPSGLNWDVWLGPAADRPFHREWLQWHRWRDFATGQLGNWAIHSTNLAFKAFRLDEFWRADLPESHFPEGRALRVTAKVSEVLTETFPGWELIEFEAPARADSPAFRMSWCNGRAPDGRARIEARLGRNLDWGDYGEKKWNDYAGMLVVGSRGMLHSTGHNMSFSLLPEDAFRELLGPPCTLPRSPGHEREWLDAIRGGPPACSNFADYGSLLTEFLLLGNVATLVEVPISYDPLTGRVLDNAAADHATRFDPRPGWAL